MIKEIASEPGNLNRELAGFLFAQGAECAVWSSAEPGEGDVIGAIFPTQVKAEAAGVQIKAQFGVELTMYYPIPA